MEDHKTSYSPESAEVFFTYILYCMKYFNQITNSKQHFNLSVNMRRRGGGDSPRTSASSVSPCGRTSQTPAGTSIHAAL